MPLNITILGLDAIGAALGLALGTIDPKTLDVGRPLITGWDANKRAMSEARGKLAVDRVQADLSSAVRDADVVFVASPVGEIREIFTTIAPALKHGAIVTDTAPTKGVVLEWAMELLPATVDFIGGHPLSSLIGGHVRDATMDALRDTIYCLVPLPRTRQIALDGLEALVTAIGAKPYYIDVAEHDAYVAAGSYLPLAVAVALMDTVSRSGGWREIQPIAGEALLQMTELASGEPRPGAEALSSNGAALASWLDRLIETLADLRDRLHDPTAVEVVLDRSRSMRDEWLRARPNVRPGEDAFHGQVDDVERGSLGGLLFGRRPQRDRDKRR